MGLGPNWYQIGSKTCYVAEVSTFYVEERSYFKRLDSAIFDMERCIIQNRT